MIDPVEEVVEAERCGDFDRVVVEPYRDARGGFGPGRDQCCIDSVVARLTQIVWVEEGQIDVFNAAWVKPRPIAGVPDEVPDHAGADPLVRCADIRGCAEDLNESSRQRRPHRRRHPRASTRRRRAR